MNEMKNILRWLNSARELGATHMFVVCDHEHEQYPVYIMPSDDLTQVRSKYEKENRFLQIYTLEKDILRQLDQYRRTK